MNRNLFTGKQVHLVPMDPDLDTATLVKWSHNSEYNRLAASVPSQIWNEKLEREWIEKEIGGGHYFTIRTLGEERMVGEIELDGIDAVVRNGWIGIGIGEREDWGKGYGTDAMRLLLNFAFAELNLNRLSLTVFAYNTRAIRCYERLGFVTEGREREWLNRDGRRWDMIYMGLMRAEWEALRIA